MAYRIDHTIVYALIALLIGWHRRRHG